MKEGYANEGQEPFTSKEKRDKARRADKKYYDLGLKSHLTHPCPVCGRHSCNTPQKRDTCKKKAAEKAASRAVMAERYEQERKKRQD